MEKKNDNLEDKIVSLNASKNDLKKEKEKLATEIKSLKKKTPKQRIEKSRSVQTDPDPQPFAKMPSNNNPSPQTFTLCSNASFSTSCSDASSQTNPTSENSNPNTLARSAHSSSTFKCLVCAQILGNERELKKHFEDDHKLSIDLQKLQDDTEEDLTTRFVRSVNIDSSYLEERKKYFPGYFDHVEERIKIRLLAQMNFTDKSQKIDRNMKKIDLKKIRYSGLCFETSQLP